MSVILVLLPVVYLAPIAVGAAAAAIKAIENRANLGGVIRVETRMKNQAMVAEALENIGYSVVADDGTLIGSMGDSTLRMSRNADGLWVGQFSADRSEEEAIETLTSLDIAYGKLVQLALIRRLEQRLPFSNMQLVNQVTNLDESITVTLEVNA